MEKHNSQDDNITKLMAEFGIKAPLLVNGSNSIYKPVTSEGVLNLKTKELIILSIAITAQHNQSIALHIDSALNSGASIKEIIETIEITLHSLK
jgi:alkylhydroperoxidase/carboxymuconolactone decarboxylase family protein YurZ